MDGGSQSHESDIYAVLMDRFHSLQASHEKLKEQFNILLQEKSIAGGFGSTSSRVARVRNSVEEVMNMQEDSSGELAGEDSSWSSYIHGAYYSGSPYKNVLECMGHAVHISRAGSEEIIYWNSSAEKLFGYKDYEVLGQRDAVLIIDEKHQALARKIMDRLSFGLSWAENTRVGQDPTDGKSRGQGINQKRIQLRAQPQIASSVSNLASKVLLRKHEDSGSDGSSNIGEKEQNELDNAYLKSERPPRAPATRPQVNCKSPNAKNKIDGDGFESEESTSGFPQPLKLAKKVLAKLHIGGIANLNKNKDAVVQCNSLNGMSCSKVLVESSSPGAPQATQATSSHNGIVDDVNHNEEHVIKGVSSAAKGLSRRSLTISDDLTEGLYPITAPVRVSEQLQTSDLQDLNTNGQNLEMEIEDTLQPQPDVQRFPNSREDSGSSIGSPSSKGDDESNLIVHCEIHWEDLQLREQIGQGSFAVVYRGIWNGSDVAVKVYFGNEYNDQTLLSYTQELDIMRRLRHPNVLLFMGAVCSQEKLALVTEYLPRGSLFKALHKSNQQLDIRRRLRMALDVARGMNYLHHRNPPIVHRDLKSSNLLVDKSWNVKVGDFGLSKLKNATFLTNKSGKGTPQWMAPEILRNEPSTEKSDIYSFGVILWELMTESIPWKNLNSLQVVGIVGFMDRRLDLPVNLDPEISSLIHDCWHSKPENRPSFQDIIQKITDLIQTGANARRSPGL
ncbi:serine/threonine-protein kinase EDR1-like isoform X3 [Coffea arabica]|uniref:Serine/threonine-protein kinase EDR1-like isoform X3 n=1 Tax=Coffea arabica TaxID=13443 RepID=A0ABM4VG15_COFAR